MWCTASLRNVLALRIAAEEVEHLGARQQAVLLAARRRLDRSPTMSGASQKRPMPAPSTVFQKPGSILSPISSALMISTCS